MTHSEYILQISFGYMHAEIWQLHDYKCSQRTEYEAHDIILKEYVISNKLCRKIVITPCRDSGNFLTQ